MAAPSGVHQPGLPGYAKNETGGFEPTMIRCSIDDNDSTSCSAKYGRRSTATRPAPRARRGANVSHNNRAPVAAAMRPAARSPRSFSASPRIKRAARDPDDRTAATVAATASLDTSAGPTNVRAGAGEPPSFHATSAGRINVAIWPGCCRAACTARAASAPTVRALTAECTQPETGRANPTTSDASGASYCAWVMAWSPTTFTIGEAARRALCRLAKPLARPGPRWSNVTGGLPAIRA